jgi:hypothetical protein
VAPNRSVWLFAFRVYSLGGCENFRFQRAKVPRKCEIGKLEAKRQNFMKEIKDKIVVITGASSEIGEATAVMLR